MNLLFLVISLFFGNFVKSDVIVTVTHPVPVTLTYDPVLGSVLPHVPTVSSDISSDNDPEMISQQEQEDNTDGKVNAKATASIRSKTTMFTSGKTSATGATTDASSAFKMSLPFAFGTVAAVIMAAIVF